MVLVLSLEPHLHSSEPLWFLHCLFMIHDVDSNWLNGILGQRHFETRIFCFWRALTSWGGGGVLQMVSPRASQDQRRYRSFYHLIFSIPAMNSNECSIAQPGWGFPICSGHASDTAQCSPVSLHWPMAKLSWALFQLSTQAFPVSCFILITNGDSCPCNGN